MALIISLIIFVIACFLIAFTTYDIIFGGDDDDKKDNN